MERERKVGEGNRTVSIDGRTLGRLPEDLQAIRRSAEGSFRREELLNLRQKNEIGIEAGKFQEKAGYLYVEIPLPAVNRGVFNRAVKTVREVCRELDVRYPNLSFFRAVGSQERRELEEHRKKWGYFDIEYFCHDDDIRGLTNAKTGTVRLRADVTPNEIERTAAHECRHLWQEKNRIPDGQAEMDAQWWADSWMKNYHYYGD
jgi:hypothetical protein